MIQSETLTLLEWPRLCRHLATFTATNIGNVAAQRLPIPISQVESEALLAQTVEATQIELTLGGLQFGGIRDIGVALERSRLQGILSGDELLDIATTLAGARRLRRQIDAQEDLPVLQALVEDLRTFPELEQEIHRCIDDRGQVADRASAKLGSVRQQLKIVRDRIYSKLQRIMQRQGGALQESLITQRNDRFVLPVKAAQKDAVPGIVHDVSTSGSTLYVEPHSIVDNGNKRRALRKEEEVESEAIRQTLTYQVAEVFPELEHLMVTVVKLDLAAARARYGLWMEGNAPRFVDAEQITLRQLTHPLLLWQQKKEQKDKVVPTDLVMRPELRVVAITGPNTGGKTVTLKTLGLAALMAKVGMFIPAKEPVELPWFDSVLADIGDEQSIEQSLSTFSGHVKRIGRILDTIDQLKGDELNGDELRSDELKGDELKGDGIANSLVLLDEVGAGTDPSEGSALAIALLKYLADNARLTVATTHYGELKSLKYEDERFENASVEFDDEKLAPTYRLLWGIPGRSNALSIAKRLGLKQSVLDQAKAQMGGANENVNTVIEGLEAQRQKQEKRAAEAEKLLTKAEKFYREVEARAQSLRDREQKLKRQQEKSVETSLLHARAEVAKVIRDLQKGGLTGQDAQRATEALNRIEEKRLPTGDHPAKVKTTGTGYRPKAGERVRLASLGSQVAEVMEEADDDGKVAVRFGIMKMTVDLSDIESLKGEKAEPIEKKPKAQPTPQTMPEAPLVKTESNTVDLRGMRVSEAESVIEDAIARAKGPLWLIHGHGTGKLRRGVQEYLKTHPQVKSFEAADQVDGGKGVTVAKI
ncbi:endonuclease MutS2 [cf. Phormidesmis sp. LEGE 11477]|uniref:endonuclease MutS2 n=1 Tax=cf. Phormidesmis sp. LEGE 11477 TaxID=1828680 RepID=UPI00187E8A47|nr:endonuclease MutS2 [cf. Phormidesmis sp. LEGE 11477]MBE9062108.1 endonuclease MutS2 [cf. Phormidesmis sp. LEGE 11477]